MAQRDSSTSFGTSTYRGRLAPSPTGYLHLGHAATFWIAQERARAAGGKLILRIEDLDRARSRRQFHAALIEDLRWLGLKWDEGPDVGGPVAPYVQSERRSIYRDAFEKLKATGLLYPCSCSRKDVLEAATAPHDEHEEPIYPGTCRSRRVEDAPADCNWRFRVPAGETLTFVDGRVGEQSATAGDQFGDFVVWRRDDVPAYHLAVVVDDAAMQITEVVRGMDLITSTFRQLLIYRALRLMTPAFYHTALLKDDSGARLAKRHAALSLRALRDSGVSAAEVRARIAG